MKFFLYIIIVSLSLTVNADEPYDKFFTESSLRIDFALSGNSISQSAAVMALSEEPLWAGPRRNLIDPFEYGGYLLYAFDNQTGTLIYSHGFNTLFEEWRTTDEARKETRSWINSIIMPYPKD
ncbi:MAG: peptidase M64, partial [Tannerella sp.]|nr:peptidase M64 [Tannerella sp.]